MKLYSGSSAQFIEDATFNRVADRLKTAFFDAYGFNPSEAEQRSWQNSLRALSNVFQYAQFQTQGILLEYQLPLTSRRLDCMVTGRSKDGRENAVIIELKQWDQSVDSDGENEVVTYVGGGMRDVLHPSIQVGRYQMYLQDTHTAFYEDNAVSLSACSYLHNYPFVSDDAVFAPKFVEALRTWPLFTKDDVGKLEEYLVPRVSESGGLDILRRVEASEYRPSKKLMHHVAQVIDGKPEYVLLDEQLVVYDKVRAAASRNSETPHVVLVKGGPGTGKSVIAINLMADLLRDGKNAQYATGSKAFTETLRTAIGSRGSVQFTYFNSYMNADRDAVDVLICDEAHRIRQFSHNRFTKKQDRTNKLQVDELLDVSRVSVFFIDDDQVVRPGEIGSVDLIKERAKRRGLQLDEFELEAQFRCAGSDAFVNWINNTLQIRRTANAIWEGAEGFDFRIFEDPFSLEQAIREKNAEGHTARVTAGFCWPWSKTPLPDGTLELDVQIGDYQRPWNAPHEASRLAPGIPKAHLWAYDPDGLDQVGCVYTAQGFEFDYVGVIFGLDLRYDLDRQEWIGDKSHSHDSVVKRSKDQFTQLVKNTYRVLLSRGMKGCYVCFLDKSTERFFRSRMAVVAHQLGASNNS